MRKILILSANPKDLTQSRLDEEVRDIKEGLKRARHRDNFEISEIWATRPRDVQRAMLSETPQFVHFSGHGSGEEGLYFEDREGNAQLVTGLALAQLFQLFSQRNKIECVILNGCYSEFQAEAIAEYVPYVIGMSQSIGNQAAIEFSVGFYDAIGNGESVEFSFKSGKVAMALDSSGFTDVPALLQNRLQLKNDMEPKEVLELKPSVSLNCDLTEKTCVNFAEELVQLPLENKSIQKLKPDPDDVSASGYSIPVSSVVILIALIIFIGGTAFKSSMPLNLTWIRSTQRSQMTHKKLGEQVVEALPRNDSFLLHRSESRKADVRLTPVVSAPKISTGKKQDAIVPLMMKMFEYGYLPENFVSIIVLNITVFIVLFCFSLIGSPVIAVILVFSLLVLVFYAELTIGRDIIDVRHYFAVFTFLVVQSYACFLGALVFSSERPPSSTAFGPIFVALIIYVPFNIVKEIIRFLAALFVSLYGS